jgi:membrane associated rhomboid family serine protease
VRDRILVALTNPEVAGSRGSPVATLVGFQEPMALFEWLGAGKALVLIRHAAVPDGGLGPSLDRVLAAHKKGLLFVAVIGGGSGALGELRAAAGRAPYPTRLGLYHADETGQLEHVAGRLLPELEKATRALPECDPLSSEDIAAIVERGGKERREAIELVRNITRRFPYVTMAIIAASFLLFVMTASGDARAQRLIALLSNRPDGIAGGEYWRLFTYALLHTQALLLIVNMFSLYSLGGFLETLLGRRRLGLLCAFAALAGGVASAWVTRTVSVGAAGIVWGLLGATLGLLTDRRWGFSPLLVRLLRQRLAVVAIVSLGMWFLPNVDRYCHVGAGLAGYLIARAFARAPARRT